MTTNIYQKLMTARIALAGLPMQKTGYNSHAKYAYWNLTDFLPQVQRCFHDAGLCGVVSFTSSLATLTIYDMESAQTIVITSPTGSVALKGLSETQALGAVQTYIRRYIYILATELCETSQIDLEPEFTPDNSSIYNEYETKNLPALQTAAQGGIKVLNSAFKVLPSDDNLNELWTRHGATLKTLAESVPA